MTAAREIAVAALACSLAAITADADVVRLRNGGELRGTIVSPPNAQTVRVETLDGILVSVSQDEVTAMVKRSLEAERYVDLAREVEDTVEARLELAKWCRANRLNTERREQMRAVLKLDPDNELARETLGYIYRDGHWLTEAAAKRADGFVKVGRRWVTPAEAALLEKIDESSAQAKAWFPKAVLIEKQYKRSDPIRRRNLLEQIAGNDDKYAVAAWVRTFASHPDPAVRLACISSLSSIGSVATIRPLAALAVEDGDENVRVAAVRAIPANHREMAAEVLCKWLTHENNTYIRNAGLAIEVMGSEVAVARLIRALVTGHWRTVQVIDNTPGFSSNGGNIGFGSQPVLPPEIEAGVRTGQYPFGVNILPPANRVRTKRVRVEVQNDTVRRALVVITGQDFGFDERAWSAWWRRARA